MHHRRKFGACHASGRIIDWAREPASLLFRRLLDLDFKSLRIRKKIEMPYQIGLPTLGKAFLIKHPNVDHVAGLSDMDAIAERNFPISDRPDRCS